MPILNGAQGVTTNGGQFNDVARDMINNTSHDHRTSGDNITGDTNYRNHKDTYSGRFNGGNFGGNGKGGNGYMGVTPKKTKQQVQEEEDSDDDSGEEEQLLERIRKAKAALKAKEKQERKEKLKAELAALEGKK